MTLREQLTEDMKTAMRAKDSVRLGTIRLLISACKQREVDERITLTDADVLAIIEKEIKKRRDSVTQYEAGKRQDLADIEKAEIVVISVYLPKQASDEEIAAVIRDTMAATGAKTPADIGKLMGPVKVALAGKADMGRVSQLVKAALAG